MDLVRRFLRIQSGVRSRSAFVYSVSSLRASILVAAEGASRRTRRAAHERTGYGRTQQKADTCTARSTNGAAGQSALFLT
jgi:hypothetical protein